MPRLRAVPELQNFSQPVSLGFIQTEMHTALDKRCRNFDPFAIDHCCITSLTLCSDLLAASFLHFCILHIPVPVRVRCPINT